MTVLAFVFWPSPTDLVMLMIVILLVLVPGLLELLGRPPAQALSSLNAPAPN